VEVIAGSTSAAINMRRSEPAVTVIMLWALPPPLPPPSCAHVLPACLTVAYAAGTLRDSHGESDSLLSLLYHSATKTNCATQVASCKDHPKCACDTQCVVSHVQAVLSDASRLYMVTLYITVPNQNQLCTSVCVCVTNIQVVLSDAPGFHLVSAEWAAVPRAVCGSG
jgi:hypothetical protein